MEKSKFVKSIRLLTKKEQQAFQQYVQTHHGSKKTAVKVLEYVLAVCQKKSPLWLSKADLAEQLFSGQQTVTPRTVGDALSDLYLLWEEFLLWTSIQKDRDFETDVLLLKHFQKRGWKQQYSDKWKRMQKNLDAKHPKDAAYFYHKMLLAHDQYFHADTPKLSTQIDSLDEAMDKLDSFFISRKLLYMCELQNRSEILQNRQDMPFFQVMERHLHQDKTLPLVIRLYRHTLQMVREQSDSSFHLLKELFFQHLSEVSQKDQIIIFGYLINFTAFKIKNGKREYTHQAFELYKEALARNTLSEGNSISHVRFNNIVNTACRLQELQWAKQFIDDWQHCLTDDIRDSALCIAIARISFEEGNFDQVIEQLRTVKFSNVYYNLRCKTLLIRSFVELKESPELITNHCRAFRAFLYRTKLIHTDTVLAFKNFTDAVEKLVQAKYETPKLKDAMEKLQPMVYNYWIEEQLAKR